MQQISPTLKRKRKFLTIVPLLVIPFLTMIFWALGGGQKADAQSVTDTNTGLNLQLPDAKFKDGKEIDKMGYYDRAAADSVKLHALMKDDPYYQDDHLAAKGEIEDLSFEDHLNSTTGLSSYESRQTKSDFDRTGYQDPNEAKVYQKLAQLNNVLTESTKAGAMYKSRTSEMAADSETSEELHRLERMIRELDGRDKEEDPELKQINTVLDKIIDVQNPTDKSAKEDTDMAGSAVDTVFNISQNEIVGSIDTTSTDVPTGTGFYGLSSQREMSAQTSAIEAVVHETQTLVNGSVIKLRLLQAVFINQVKIDKGSMLSGIVTLNNERLNINISSVLYRNNLFHVKMQVYDQDGLAGIFIPGTISRDVARQSANNSVQGLGLTALDPSVGMQAANAGIETAKNLIGKRVKQVKVEVTAGHKVFIYDQNISK